MITVLLITEHAMKTVQITIPDDQASLVERLIADGHWDSIESLFMYGLQRAQEDVDGERSTEEIEAVRLGLAQADRGELVDGPATLERLRTKLKDARKQPA